MPSLDLDAYFERVQWGGPTSPTYETVAGILEAHLQHIPFENLDVLLGRPIRLDLDGLQDKLIRARRGGYCFEHATLFAAVLERLGFRTMPHSARVVLFLPRTEAPRTHMFLRVAIGAQTFVIDPGLGGPAPRFPVPLPAGVTAPPDDRSHWIVQEGRYWVLRMQSGEQPVDAWESLFDRDNPLDFEMGNHFTATHPRSAFVNRLMLRAFTPEGRVSVMNREVSYWHASEARARQLPDRSALRALLVEHFGFDLPEVERLRVPTIPEWS